MNILLDQGQSYNKDTYSRINGTIPIKNFWTRVKIAFLNIMPSANDYWTRLWMVQLHVMSKARSIWSWNICGGWGMQQLFVKDGLNTMLVTTKLVLSEVSTKVAAQPIKKSCSCFSATCCYRCLLSIPLPAWFQTEQLSRILLNSNLKLA